MEAPINIIARLAPGAAVETDLYTVEPDEIAKIQGVTVANRGAALASFRFSISPLGAPTQAQDYVYYDLGLDGNDTFMALLNADVRPNDVVRVYASTADLTFILYGGPR